MPRLQADMDTLQRVREVLALALERNLDAAEALDRAGLLLYSKRTMQITANMLYDTADLVDQMTVRQLAAPDRMPTSPLDMKRQIATWMRTKAGEFKKAVQQ